MNAEQEQLDAANEAGYDEGLHEAYMTVIEQTICNLRGEAVRIMSALGWCPQTTLDACEQRAEAAERRVAELEALLEAARDYVQSCDAYLVVSNCDEHVEWKRMAERRDRDFERLRTALNTELEARQAT